MAVISNIQRNYGNMFSAEKRAADFILQYPEQIIEHNYTISELAARCGASEASIIRMCKRIGYAGFASLKITLAREQEIREDRERIGTVRREIDDVAGYIEQLIREIQYSARNIDQETVNACVDLIINSEMITTMAWGNTNTIAADFAARLVCCHLNAFNTETTDYAIRRLDLMPPSGVLVAISHSGTALLVNEAMRLAQNRGIKTILITNTPNSPAQQYADFLLCTNNTGHLEHKFGCDSHIMELIIVDILIYFIQRRLRLEENTNDAELLLAQFHRYLYLSK